MTLTWLVSLAIYGAIVGFANVPAMAWILLVPFAVRDVRADMRNRRMDKHARAIALLIDRTVTPADDSLEAAIDAGIAGSLMAQGPKKQGGGLSSAMVGVSMTEVHRAELKRRADARGMTTQEMMIELLSERLKLRGIELDHAIKADREEDDNL